MLLDPRDEERGEGEAGAGDGLDADLGAGLENNEQYNTKKA